MRRTVLGLTALLGLSACGPNADEFRAGVPATGSAALRFPGTEGALTNGLPDYYVATFRVTNSINGLATGVLELSHRLSEVPPTKWSPSQSVWGPWHPGPLDPNVFKLTVTKKGSGYAWRFEGKPKDAADSAFVTVASGENTPNRVFGMNDPDHGKGKYTVDFDARNTLPNPDTVTGGKVSVAYDHHDDGLVVDVKFDAVKAHDDDAVDKDKVVTADYHFRQPAKGDGTFQFTIDKLEGTSAAADAPQFLSIESRWKPDGAGRADVQASRGFGGPVIGRGSQCWDTHFTETFFRDPLGETTRGAEGACAFDKPEFFSP